MSHASDTPTAGHAHAVPKNHLLNDKTSKLIIEALQVNARITNRELAELVHLSPSACLNRTKRLESMGYIRRYTLALNLDRTFAHVLVMAEVKLGHLNGGLAVQNFERHVANTACAVECYRVGGAVDYLVLFMCRSVEHYNQLLEHLLASNAAISVTSHVVESTPKSFTRYPLNELTAP